MYHLIQEKVDFINNYMASNGMDAGEDIAVVVLKIIYGNEDLSFLEEHDVKSIINGKLPDVFDVVVLLENVLEAPYNLLTALVSLTRDFKKESPVQHVNGLDYDVTLGNGIDAATTCAIPHVIKHLFDYTCESVDVNKGDSELLEGISRNIKNSVNYEYSPVVINEYFSDLLKFDYQAIDDQEPICGVIGSYEKVYVASVDLMLLPDKMENNEDVLKRFKSVGKELGSDILVMSMYPAVNSLTAQTCLGYSYSLERDIWFPLFICSDKTFDECYENSEDGIPFQDNKSLMAHAFARVQGGMTKDVGEVFMVTDYAYDDSDWVHLEMSKVVG